MSSVALDCVALEMRSAQDEARQVTPFSERVPGFDLPGAYRVADAIHRHRLAQGRRPLGRKIGFTNRGIWDQYGVHQPMWGWMYDSTVVQVGDGRATCPMAGLADPRLEPEIVFRIARPIAPHADPEDVLASVDGIAHGFELVQSHFPDWRFAIGDTVADQGLHGRLYVGPFRDPRALGPELVRTLESFAITLSRGGGIIERSTGASVLDSPLKALAHLVDVLAEQGDDLALRPGEIVTTGTITKAYPVRAGETWSTGLEGLSLPGMEIRFTP